MATLETPADYRIQDVPSQQSIIKMVAPETGVSDIAEQAFKVAANSTRGLVRRVVNPDRGSFEAAVSSLSNTDVPRLGWPPFRIYYPAGTSAGATPLEGPFPLVIFVHGQRNPDSTGFYADPSDPDPDQDYKRWGGVLHLLARTGIVVASVQMTGALGPGTAEEAAQRIRSVERWMHHRWEHRDILVSWVTDGRRRDHRQRPLGLIGHSWGIEGCARLARERDFVKAVAGVAATWSWDVPLQDIIGARVPSLFVAGTEDFLANPSAQPYQPVDPPKHLAAVQGAGHWDWFDDEGLTPPDVETRCQEGYRIAGELLAVFLHRYLNNRSDLPPSLLTMRRRWRWLPPRKKWVSDTAGRPALSLSSPCALKVDWNVDEQKSWEEPVNATGSKTLGSWT